MYWQGSLGIVPPSTDSSRPPAYEALRGGNQVVEIGSISQRVPIYSRLSGKLALVYGYPDLTSFCDDLPENGVVLDVGAGASTLGLDVCQERPDVSWLNADICYEDEEKRQKLIQDSPSNLEFLPANVLNLQEYIGDKKFDRVFSFFLLPHIRLAGRKYAIDASRELIRAAAPSGKVSIGPLNRKARRKLTGRVDSLTDAITLDAPSDNEALESATQLVASATEKPLLDRVIQGLLNGKYRKDSPFVVLK